MIRVRNQPLPRWIVDAGPCGGVARFVNHSCDPNLFVQPVLSRHHDEDLPYMAFFANSNIPPFTPLTCVNSHAIVDDYDCGLIRASAL